MPKKSLLKSNMSVVVIAFFLSFAVYSLATNHTDIATNIQGAVVSQAVTADLRVSVEGDMLILTSQKDITWVSDVSLLALYDVETVNRSDDWVKTQYTLTISSTEPGEVSLIIDLWKESNIDAWDEILRIDVNWDPYGMIFSDIALRFEWGDAESVSFEMP